MRKPLRTYTFQEMLETLETKPLSAALQAQRKNVTLTRLKYEISAIAYGVALKLRDDSDDLDSFYELDFWTNRTYKRNAEHLLAHVHVYVYGSDQGTEAKRARNHAGALRHYFDSDEPIPPAEMANFLQDNGGFGGLYKLNSPGIEVEDDDEGKVDDEEERFAGSEENLQAGDVTIGAPSVQGTTTMPKKVTAAVVSTDSDKGLQDQNNRKGTAGKREEDPLKGMKRTEIADHLLLQWSDEQREGLLAIDVGSEVTLTVVRAHDTKDGFAVFELTEFA